MNVPADVAGPLQRAALPLSFTLDQVLSGEYTRTAQSVDLLVRARALLERLHPLARFLQFSRD